MIWLLWNNGVMTLHMLTICNWSKEYVQYSTVQYGLQDNHRLILMPFLGIYGFLPSNNTKSVYEVEYFP